jgi:hypothetical protein
MRRQPARLRRPTPGSWHVRLCSCNAPVFRQVTVSCRLYIEPADASWRRLFRGSRSRVAPRALPEEACWCFGAAIRPTIGVPIWLWLNLGAAPFQRKRPAFTWLSLDLPIIVDTGTSARAMRDTATLAVDRRLSLYDAAELDAPESRSAWPGRSRRLAREAGSAQTHLRFLRA